MTEAEVLEVISWSMGVVYRPKVALQILLVAGWGMAGGWVWAEVGKFPGPPLAPRLAVLNFAARGGRPGAVPQAARNSKSPATVTVMPFTAVQGQSHDWLGKALADLLIADLSEVESMAVLDRECMQAFVSESKLGETGLFSKDSAVQLGRVAKVNEVMYGNYSLDGGAITIAVFLVNLATQEVERVEEISGPLRNFRKLVSQLTLKFLKNRQVALSEEERKAVQYEATDSISATAHYYRGMDDFDRGQYADALGEFLGAVQQDSNYIEAMLWVGRLFDAAGHDLHAIASYRRLAREQHDRVEALDALFFAGLVAESAGDPQGAIGSYEEISRARPNTPHMLEAWYRLGLLYQQQGQLSKALENYKRLDAFFSPLLLSAKPLPISAYRASAFFNWRHAATLVRNAAVHQVELFQQLVETGTEDLPTPPRGVFAVDPEDPVIGEKQFGKLPSFFLFKQADPGWREELFVAVAPAGQAFTGADLTLRGQLFEARPDADFSIRVLPFPLPRDFYYGRLGAIFGQTPQLSTLRRTLSMHGRPRKLLAFSLLETRSTIHSWRVRMHLAREEPGASDPKGPSRKGDVPRFSKKFWEGILLSEVPLPPASSASATRELRSVFNKPRRELDLLQRPDGSRLMVTVAGELDGEETNLWLTSSQKDGSWSPFLRLQINSHSDDYDPQLRLAEDGRIWLAWLSNRRGRGWELWMSSSRNGARWANPIRVPLEEFAKHGLEKRWHQPSVLLNYDLIQNQRGRWLLTFYSPGTRCLVFLSSADAVLWKLEGKIRTYERMVSLGLRQVRDGVYWLAAIGLSGRFYLWSSTEGQQWREASPAVRLGNYQLFPGPGIHRVKLLEKGGHELLALGSDNLHGLQFAWVKRGTRQLNFDLVTRTGLGAFAAVRGPGDQYLVARRQGNSIAIRAYRKFNVSGKAIEQDTRAFPIYEEREQDESGNTWFHYFAQERARVSDVSCLAVNSNGGIWWGIESGVMFKDGTRFFVSDVSQGFFSNSLTQICCCGGETVWFASRYIEKPVLGFAATPLGPGGFLRSKSIRSSRLEGRLVTLGCGRNKGDLILGTDRGEILGIGQGKVLFQKALPGGGEVVALSMNRKTGELWTAVRGRGLVMIQGNRAKEVVSSAVAGLNSVVSLVHDAEGALWCGTFGYGLLKYEAGKWRSFVPENSQVAYSAVGALRADPVRGVWYLASNEANSRGLAYFDGQTGRLLNPPHRILDSPSALGVAPNGDVWVGTWFDGLFQLHFGGKN